MYNTEPHFFAICLANESACAILEFLPDSDLIEELRNLIYIQNDLLKHVIESKHYGSNNLDIFFEYAQDIKKQIKRIREASNEM